jgi:hypothetical protein
MNNVAESHHPQVEKETPEFILKDSRVLEPKDESIFGDCNQVKE